MSDLVGNPEDWFSRVVAQIKLPMKTTHQFLIELHFGLNNIIDYVNVQNCHQFTSILRHFKNWRMV